MTKLFSFILALMGLGSDVITVTTGTVATAGNTVADLITYLSAKLLEVAEFNCILDQFGDKHPLPSNSSKTIRFVIMNKLSSTVPSQLTEGVAPDSVGVAMDQIEATVEQYGVIVRISDLAELTADFGGIISKYQGTPTSYATA